jgi:hypothetical protein
MLMMAEFFESVNAYRDAMRAHVAAEQAATAAADQLHAGSADSVQVSA